LVRSVFMSHLFARSALLGGNFITGISVLAPAGMLNELSQGLGVTIRDAGLLVTYGAVVLCLGSPIMSWLTSQIGRRALLSATLAIISLGHIASALAESYGAVLALRLIMLAFIAIYTPQAASTIALVVPEKMRASAISFVFLGWSLTIAVGLPLITFLATHFGWRETYAAIGLFAAAIALLNVVALPSGLKGHPISLGSFALVARDRVLVLILLISLLQMSGQFAIVIYLAPLLSKLADIGPASAGLFFSLLGIAGLLGNVIATNAVARVGVQRMLGACILVMLLGGIAWSLGAGSLLVMGAGIFMLGLGLASANSMQQARLVAAAPLLATVTVALNTSILYVGQAFGSATAGFLYANGSYRAVGFVAVAFFIAAFAVFLLTQREPR
jgi:DHA1 family inner membrane transport protein